VGEIVNREAARLGQLLSAIRAVSDAQGVDHRIGEADVGDETDVEAAVADFHEEGVRIGGARIDVGACEIIHRLPFSSISRPPPLKLGEGCASVASTVQSSGLSS
jgi:hypothetical protein